MRLFLSECHFVMVISLIPCWLSVIVRSARYLITKCRKMTSNSANWISFLTWLDSTTARMSVDLDYTVITFLLAWGLYIHVRDYILHVYIHVHVHSICYGVGMSVTQKPTHPSLDHLTQVVWSTHPNFWSTHPKFCTTHPSFKTYEKTFMTFLSC